MIVCSAAVLSHLMPHLRNAATVVNAIAVLFLW